MIVFNKLGHMGRMGNQLFQIASLLGIADKCNQEARINKWEYSQCFPNLKLSTIGEVNYWMFREGHENFFRPETFELKENWQLEGYFQSEKYFEHIKGKVQDFFEFAPSISHYIKKKYQLALALEPISMHVRVGDFKNIGWYAGDRYYLDMLTANQGRLVLCFSDDIAYCKRIFAGFENVMYIEENEVHSLCLMSMCKTHIMSASTFSWWGAWLSGSNSVYYPDVQSGNYPNRDFYPSAWTKINTHTCV